MKYYLSGPGYTKHDKRHRDSRMIESELGAVQTAYAFFYANPIKQVDVVRLTPDGKQSIVMKLHRREGKVDPAVWLRSTDEVTEPAL